MFLRVPRLWLSWFQFWQLPDFGNSGDLFLQPSADVPSARPPPPIGVLLKTNAKPQFDRAVDRAVEALFRVFSALNPVVTPVLPFLFQRQRISSELHRKA